MERYGEAQDTQGERTLWPWTMIARWAPGSSIYSRKRATPPKRISRGPTSWRLWRQGSPDLLITDLVLDGIKGVDVLRRAKQHDPSLAVIMITAFGTIETAVEAMRLGAFYYLTKPFKSADLLLLVERALEEKYLRTEIRRLQQEVEGITTLIALLPKARRCSTS